MPSSQAVLGVNYFVNSFIWELLSYLFKKWKRVDQKHASKTNFTSRNKFKGSLAVTKNKLFVLNKIILTVFLAENNIDLALGLIRNIVEPK